MWNVLITMTTVGYGDIYPKSHLGKMIGIITAFWGVFFLSLFVVSLTNITSFNFSEIKAFILLQRLQAKDQLREQAVGMLAAAYKIKLLKKDQNFNPDQLKYLQREFRNHKLKF